MTEKPAGASASAPPQPEPRVPELLWEDAQRGFRALIGEVDASGDSQRKTAWCNQAWHRRLTWVRWLRQLNNYMIDQHTMALARNVENEKLTERLAAAEAQLSEARRQYRPEYGKAPLEAKQPPGSRIPALVTKLKNRNRMIIANNCWGDRHGLNHAYEVRTIIELMESELARTGAALLDAPPPNREKP